MKLTKREIVLKAYDRVLEATQKDTDLIMRSIVAEWDRNIGDRSLRECHDKVVQELQKVRNNVKYLLRNRGLR